MIINGDCLIEMAKMEDNSIDFIVTDPPYGLSFMGKDWDGKIPSMEYWQQALRIVKPGSMLAAFGGSRTHHHLMLAIEKAGWEIRDVIMWIYGSGFPKSHNVSKAIDREKGLIREIIGRKEGERYKYAFNSDFNSEQSNSRLGSGDAGILTKSASELAEKFDCYGTALKPAYEPIILAMKPLEGTYAQNAEKWGLAGINIDESRIGTIVELNKGRWPANIIFDEEAAEQLDQMTGISHSRPHKNKPKNSVSSFCASKEEAISPYNDSGGASRFFYCAKASNKERNRGLEGMPLKPGGSNTKGFTQDVANGLDRNKPVANHHPTVKPIALMKYIIKLLAPPNNPTLLDPFAGSGSTLLAAKELGINAIGIEKQAEYFEIATKRLENVKISSQMELFYKI